ncbi:MAG: response regulator transcription factor [Acidobacteriota bacterium]|nr:response regulator transcription factor [Blastocatellia bacterium]MDW8239472.1 response regulator transcription factor [Acidobacteriota bacterium]
MRVLLVEDERKMAESLKRGLQEEGYVVDIARDGEEGWHYGTQYRYDVIILDIVLPVRSGIELCRELRRQKIKTPILMLTARDTVEAKVEALDSGADDYLTKPFAFAELLARLRALQRRGQLDPSLQLHAADLVLDPVTRRVSRAGRDITLTPKEFALLECLLRHKNRILSRAILAEAAWGESFDALTNVIDVYINYLRNKIDRDFEPKLIHTIRGAGYMLKDEPVRDS